MPLVHGYSISINQREPKKKIFVNEITAVKEEKKKGYESTKRTVQIEEEKK